MISVVNIPVNDLDKPGRSRADRPGSGGAPWAKCLLVVTCAVLGTQLALGVAPFDAPAGFRVQADGSLALDEIAIHIQHFAPGSRSATQSRSTVSGTPVVERHVWQLDGRFTCADGKQFALTEKITRSGPQTMAYTSQLSSREPIPTQQVALSIDLPIQIFTGVPLIIGEETLLLPETPLAKTLRWRDVRRLACPTPRGRLVLEGTLNVQLQDGRNFADQRHFRLRVLFRPDTGELRSSSLSLALRIEPYAKGEKRPAFEADRGVSLGANADWQPLEHHVFTRAGSVLDWSRMNQAPAGKDGRVVVRDGHFEFANRAGSRVRFFGANLCDRANYLDKPDCEALAAQLSRLGHNAVRLHHYDRHLVKTGRTLAAGWDGAQLDRLDNLFHCLKQAGLYITIDLYTVRKVVAGEIEEVNREVSLNEFKALVALSPSARANWKEFARRLLTHVNPYTGLAWKDDPALFGICLLNEDNPTVHWESAPDIAALYEKRFAGWQREQGPNKRSRAQQWARFLIETHTGMTRELTAYLRGLGVKSLITGANYRQDLPLALVRRDLDYVDNHSYHDLKKFLSGPFQLPYGFHRRSAIAGKAELPRSLFGARQFGKPYTVTEFNYCYPNPFRAEGGPLFGAYAALQDWDAVFRYAYAHSPERATTAQPIFYLDNAGDPLNLLADRIVTLLFRRGDVRPASTRIPYLFSDACLDLPNPLARPQGFMPEEFELLGLINQVGSLPVSQAAAWSTRVPFAVTREPAGAEIPPALEVLRTDGGILQRFLASKSGQTQRSSLEAKQFISETGEIRLECAQGRMSVVTAPTECFVVSGPDSVRGNAVALQNYGGFAVVCVSAMDDRPLATSRRLLVIHLTDVQNSAAKFRDTSQTVLKDWGRLPHLVRRGTVDILLHRGDPGNLVIRAVKLDGAPAQTMDTRRNGDTWTFTAATVQPQGTFLLYEIERP